jgi:MoxR-like ATPase
MDLESIQAATRALREQVHRVVVGQEAAVELMLVALLAEGHVLIEGVPGTAKTLLAHSFAAGLALGFKRVQFTPDLMPGDITGTNLFNFQTNQFVLTRGPIFTDILLADELNRTPPKTQAALLQAMQERAVTIDGVTHELGAGFMVIATQNPIEQEGTYPLPEAQLDRFLFKIRVDYPSREQEREMVRLHGHRTSMPRIQDFDLRPIADLAFIEEARAFLAKLHLAEDVADYVVDLVRATRRHPALAFGASPRATNMLATAARAHAVLTGRDFVLPDDVKALCIPALRHRVVLAPSAEIEGLAADTVIQQVLEQVAPPR